MRAVVGELIAVLLLGCNSESLPDAGISTHEIVGGHAVGSWSTDSVAGPLGLGWPQVVYLDGLCTGTLIHPEVVIYAGHCGTDINTIWIGNRFQVDLEGDLPSVLPDEEPFLSITPMRCAAHPEAGIGTGTDLAYCVLREPLDEIPPVPPIAGCERDAVAVGSATTLVGFGFEAYDGVMPGIKRSVEAQVAGHYVDFTIGDNDAGSCWGDSGGPAFIEVSGNPDPTARDWRLLGVLSSGEQGNCGVGYYTDIARFLPWLEMSSQRDVTPCSDSAGNWEPTPECMRTAIDDEGFVQDVHMPADTCGPPFERKPVGSCTASAAARPSAAAEFVALLGVLMCCRAAARRRRSLARVTTAPSGAKRTEGSRRCGSR